MRAMSSILQLIGVGGVFAAVLSILLGNLTMMEVVGLFVLSVITMLIGVVLSIVSDPEVRR